MSQGGGIVARGPVYPPGDAYRGVRRRVARRYEKVWRRAAWWRRVVIWVRIERWVMRGFERRRSWRKLYFIK